jgi:tetratricopeptide (TPR) repeat protein
MKPTKQLISVVITITLFGVLSAFLFIQGCNNSTALADKETNHEHLEGNQATFNYEELEKDVENSLTAVDKQTIQVIKNKLEDKTDKNLVGTYQEIADFYKEKNQEILAARYFALAAKTKKDDASLWSKAGKSFYNATELVTDSNSRAFFTTQSIEALQKTLELNPNDLDAKADLAANYIEGQNAVMLGVGLLKEIEQVDSTHKRALLYLGVLSMRSQQFDKAISRFKKLTQIPNNDNDPDFPYYHRYLGQAYQSSGNNAEALNSYLAYRQLLIKENANQALIKEADDLVNLVKPQNLK